MQPTLRIARPTQDFKPILRFYADGLGLTVLAEFKDHAGFDGLILGHPRAPYHFEFVKEHAASHAAKPSNEDLVVLYVPVRNEWLARVTRLETLGYRAVASNNPYWDQVGKTFEDPDGYRLVLQNSAWSL